MIKLKAFAKINLSLEVISRRYDGYHEIDSIMQSVSLYDEVTLQKTDSDIALSCDDPNIPLDNKNIAYKAAEAFFAKTGVRSGIKIDIRKKIPVAAGLAGGSADAAAVLIGMNELYNTKLSESELSVLGAGIGSDVPFCLIGGLCRCRGRGELVEKIPVTSFQLPNVFVLVKPDFEVSTKWVYENLDIKRARERHQIGDHLLLNSITMFNDLESVAISKYPEIQKIKDRLVQLGCLKSQMSGSGSTVFGLASDEQSAQKIFNEIKKEYPRKFVVMPVASGIEILNSNF